MTMTKIFDYCIVGGGPSGLTSAYELLKKNKKILMIERDSRVGGLAKSYNYNGHIFDTGPKRFHTDDPIVQSFLEEIMNMDIIGRSTKVHFMNRYFDWPLNLKSIFKMPPSMIIKTLYDLLNKDNLQDINSFENYIKLKYGNNLFNLFFKPYTEKFLKWNAADIHADWALTGINRTVIDKKVNANSILDIIKSLTLPQKIDTKFLYPKEGGFGNFFEKIFQNISSNYNFEIKLNSKVNKIHKNEKYLLLECSDGTSIKCEDLIWTGNLNNLSSLINKELNTNLHYINTIFYNFITPEKNIKKNKSQWIYVSDGKKLISRITCMKEFSESTTPAGYYNFIVEITDSQREPLYFEEPRKILDQAISELINMNFIKNSKDILDIKINSIQDTYPIYHKQYKVAFNTVLKGVKSFSKNIHLLGRSGAYWYNNSDHSIRMAIELAKKLLKKNHDFEFDYRRYF